MARPRKEKDSVREVRLNLRLTLDERAELEAKASAALLSPSEFARMIGRSRRFRRRFSHRAPNTIGKRTNSTSRVQFERRLTGPNAFAVSLMK